MYLLLAVNNCVKNAFNEYSKVRCALGLQQECCDPFLLLFMCQFARLRMPVYEDAEGAGGGQKPAWVNGPENRECSFNGDDWSGPVQVSVCELLPCQSDNDVLRSGAFKAPCTPAHQIQAWDSSRNRLSSDLKFVVGQRV